MLKALIFKEWLKIRWATLIILAIYLLLMGKMALNMSYAIRIFGANNFWYDIITRGILFFDDLLYVPVLAGVVIAAFQFFPEISENRLKLTLHLPLNENAILLYMTAMGSISVLIVSGLALVVLSIITVLYFPTQVLSAVLLTTGPWLIAGLIGYFCTITIFVEPIWIKRVFFIGVSYLFISELLAPDKYNVFIYTLLPFLFIALFFSISVLFPGHRFRKGVLK